MERLIVRWIRTKFVLKRVRAKERRASMPTGLVYYVKMKKTPAAIYCSIVMIKTQAHRFKALFFNKIFVFVDFYPIIVRMLAFA